MSQGSVAPFTVTPDSVAALAGRISGLSDDVRNIASSVAGGDVGAAGDPGLEHAMAEYLHVWSTGLGELGDWLSELQRALSDAAEGYSTADSTAHAAFAS